MKFSFKNLKLIFTLTAFSFILYSCTKNEDSVNRSNEVKQEYFFLKNVEGHPVTEIEPELRNSIYLDLKESKGEEIAENFLDTYNIDGKAVYTPKNIKILSNNKEPNDFSYGYHVEGLGWDYGIGISELNEGTEYLLGTTGEGRRLEAFFLNIDGITVGYEAHVSGIGWQGMKYDGEIAGTTGNSKRMEAIRAQITDGYCYYRSHISGMGWESSWSYENQISGTTGQSKRLEAFEIRFYLY